MRINIVGIPKEKIIIALFNNVYGKSKASCQTWMYIAGRAYPDRSKVPIGTNYPPTEQEVRAILAEGRGYVDYIGAVAFKIDFSTDEIDVTFYDKEHDTGSGGPMKTAESCLASLKTAYEPPVNEKVQKTVSIEKADIVCPEINRPSIIKASSKEEFLNILYSKLKESDFKRADILDLFAQIKKRDGSYGYIHHQRNPMWDRIRLFFKSPVLGQDETNFWHTATYQKAVKLLKEAYVARGVEDQSDKDREVEANAFIDYVRGNSPVHFSKTSTRCGLK